MTEILNFFEQYWGYTLFGGVTIGTLVGFIVTAVKTLATNAKNSKDNNELTESVTKELKEAKRLVETQSKQLEEQAAEVKSETDYNAQVQALLFKGLSYLIMSSKLDLEDKTSFCNALAKLTKKTSDEVVEASKEVETKVEEANVVADQVKTDVIETVEKATTLLEKYK